MRYSADVASAFPWVVRTPPRAPRVTIQEPPTQVGTNVASSSRFEGSWQPTFTFGGKPLPTSASVRVWAQGKGCRVAWSLVHDLLLPEDIHVFADATEESLASRLQWHTVAVISYPFVSMYAHSFRLHTYHYYFIRLHNYPISLT